MVSVNQFFKPPNYLPGRISSKTSRKVVQKYCEGMSAFHITLTGRNWLLFALRAYFALYELLKCTCTTPPAIWLTFFHCTRVNCQKSRFFVRWQWYFVPGSGHIFFGTLARRWYLRVSICRYPCKVSRLIRTSAAFSPPTEGILFFGLSC